MVVDPRQQITFLGKCNFRGNEKIFGIKRADRRQHMYVIGKTGTGKSALLKNMALQDVYSGRGLTIVDPHGEFVEEVLSKIPEERINDVVYLNPVDVDFPIGFNVLEVPDAQYKHLVVSDLLGIFTKIWANVWSARMEYILQNCIMALLDTPGTTLLGVPRLLVDKDYRQKIVANIKDPVVRSFWIQEYETWREQFRSEAIVPIQNKVGQFLNTSFIRNIIGQSKSTMNIAEIMNHQKILLVNVSKGKVGEDNSALLGAMIITKIQLAAMERVRIPEEERKDFYLYVDEFQNFATDSFAAILSEARKYRLNLVIAHQYIGQLVTDVSTKVRDAVFGNVGTMISFRVGAADAEFLEKEFEPEFMIQDLINLPNYNIYLKLMVDGMTSRPFSAATLPPLTYEVSEERTQKIIDVSRRNNARPREEAEKEINEWTGVFKKEDTAPAFIKESLGPVRERSFFDNRQPRFEQNRQSAPPRQFANDNRPPRQDMPRQDNAPRPQFSPRPPQERTEQHFEPRPERQERPQRDFQERPQPGSRSSATFVRSPSAAAELSLPGKQQRRFEPVVRASQQSKPVSLGELKPPPPREERRDSVPRPPISLRENSAEKQPQASQPKIDVSELKKVLAETLKEKPRKENPPRIQAEDQGDDGVIKPGETVKL